MDILIPPWRLTLFPFLWKLTSFSPDVLLPISSLSLGFVINYKMNSTKSIIPIIAPMDAEFLARQKLFLVSGGKSILHKRRLKSSSEQKYSHIPLSVLWPSNDAHPCPWTAFEQLPVALFSPETLLYVGLKASAVKEIWPRWVHREEQILPAGGNVNAFFNFFVSQVVELPSELDHTNEEQWAILFSNCESRLNSETRAVAYTVGGYWEYDMIYGAAIKFHRLARARVCCVWNLLRKRYWRLLHIRHTSLQRERIHQEAMGAMEASFTNMEIGGQIGGE